MGALLSECCCQRDISFGVLFRFSVSSSPLQVYSEYLTENARENHVLAPHMFLRMASPGKESALLSWKYQRYEWKYFSVRSISLP